MTEPASDQLVRTEISDGIATITLDSQRNRNALSRQLLAELNSGIDAAEAADARALILRHEGPAFCAGADLKERSDQPADSTPFVSILERLMDTERPTIAAVDGAVRAGGIGLMASCDLVVVNTATTFALTEVRIGVAAAIISVPILRRVPAGKIAAAMLTGEVFDADEARSIGLITHLADDVAHSPFSSRSRSLAWMNPRQWSRSFSWMTIRVRPVRCASAATSAAVASPGIATMSRRTVIASAAVRPDSSRERVSSW